MLDFLHPDLKKIVFEEKEELHLKVTFKMFETTFFRVSLNHDKSIAVQIGLLARIGQLHGFHWLCTAAYRRNSNNERSSI